MTKEAIVNEIHKTARKNFRRRNVILKGIDDLWQADLIDLQKFKQFNNGYKYILVVIDCFSKYAWSVKVKSKSKSDITQAFEKVLTQSSRHPNNLQTDMGTEFYNQEFKKLMVSHNINHYSTYSVKKASIVERLIRTLKSKLFKCFSLNGNYKWIGQTLNNVMNTYNNTVHRTIKYKPVEVNDTIKNSVMRNITNSYLHLSNKGKERFRIGDHVRISKYKGDFEKGYTPNWSTEIFLIDKINQTRPRTYNIIDLRKQPILGCFYEQELQKTNHPGIYLIEKIIKKKGNKLFVKWLGFHDNENTWIDKKAVV